MCEKSRKGFKPTTKPLNHSGGFFNLVGKLFGNNKIFGDPLDAQKSGYLVRIQDRPLQIEILIRSRIKRIDFRIADRLCSPKL